MFSLDPAIPASPALFDDRFASPNFVTLLQNNRSRQTGSLSGPPLEASGSKRRRLQCEGAGREELGCEVADEEEEEEEEKNLR